PARPPPALVQPRDYHGMHRLSVVVTLVVLAGGVGFAVQALTERDAEVMGEKLQAIVDRSVLEPGDRTPLVTSFTERQVNAYLRFVAGPTLPVGLLDPTIAIGDNGKVSGRARVDLDAIRKSKPRSALDPMAYLSGTVEVAVAGVLESSRGQGKVTLGSATVGGVSVPKSLVQEMVSYFTRTPENPQGVDLDRPFDLPARIQQVRTRAGHATIVQ
ncbi:MAG TPA: hypothetical protein VMM93_08425, partial [Vicinamibacterales bacterium]|nr:hypothetical protein [Vicinamibacterales bacterium]